MQDLKYDILIESNHFMFPESSTHPIVVDSVYNRNNTVYQNMGHKTKHLFNMCVVLNDCDFSNQPLLHNNLTSPAIVFGTYNIENTKISDLKDAPRFAFKGANIKGTPLSEELGKDFLSAQEYNKLWQRYNDNVSGELTDLTVLPEKMEFSDESQHYDAKTVYIFNNVILPETVNNILPNYQNIVALGNFDCSNCPNLRSLHNGVMYIGGDLNISGTRISNLYEAIPPRCLKGNLICTGSRLAEKIGKDIITPDEYQKIWDAMNQRNNYYSTTNLYALKGLSRGGRSK